jgi:hypothetical protein
MILGSTLLLLVELVLILLVLLVFGLRLLSRGYLMTHRGRLLDKALQASCCRLLGWTCSLLEVVL